LRGGYGIQYGNADGILPSPEEERMGLNRRDRVELNRKREQAAAIGGDGLKVEAAPEFKCDECGKASGTLYHFDGRLVCGPDAPFEYRYGTKSHLMIGRAVSGQAALQKKRRELATT
jgi:hypothetical protein